MARTVATDPATKAEALRLAAEFGPAEAARQTDVPAGTIRAWLSRERVREAATGATAGSEDVEQLRRTAKRARDVVERAIERINELLPTSRNARDVSIAAGVLADKALQLEQIVLTLDERQIRLEQSMGEVVAAVVGAVFDAVGLPLAEHPAVRTVLRELLGQAASASVLVVSPANAEAAFAEVRLRVGAELREEIERELHERITPDWIAEHRGLPAGGETEVRELTELASPRPRVAEPEPEHVDGEIVDELSVAARQPRGGPFVATAVRRSGEYQHSGAGLYGSSEFS